MVRINRSDLANQLRRRHVAANANARGSRFRRRRQSRAGATDDAAKHAARLTARNATGNATDDANRADIGRHFFFLDHFDFLGDNGGRHHLSIVNQARHRLHDFRRSCSRRRRRGRRRRRHQESRQHSFGQSFRIDERNQNQDAQQSRLNDGRKHHGPRLVGPLRIRAGDD